MIFPSPRHARPVLLGVALAACADRPTTPATQYAYVIDVTGQRFTVRATEPTSTQALEARLRSRRTGVISGVVAKGDGGFNAPWHWHLLPHSVAVPDVAIELCDGTPAMVEANVDAWIANSPRFCPWSATVASRRPHAAVGGGR